MADSPLDPDYVMIASTGAALERLIRNPAVDPITTPPNPEAFSARIVGGGTRKAPQAGPGDAPANMPTATLPPPPAPAKIVRLSDAELTDEVQQAMAVLKGQDIVEQVDKHTWRFK